MAEANPIIKMQFDMVSNTTMTPNNALHPTAAAPATSNVPGLVMAASLRSTITPGGCG